MKVLKKALITLALAVPLNLVSADEPLKNIDTHHVGKGGHNYSQDTKQVLIPSPMTFKDVVVVAPRLDKKLVAENTSTEMPATVKQDDLSASPELAFNEANISSDVDIQ